MAIATVAESAGTTTRPSSSIRCRLSARAVTSILAIAKGAATGDSGPPDRSKYSKSNPVVRGLVL
jgi:hypothetical protein